MNQSIEVHGEAGLLKDLAIELQAKGIETRRSATSLAAGAGHTPEVLQILAGAAPVAAVVTSYLRNRRGHVSMEIGESKITVDAKTTADAERLLRSGVVQMKQVEQKRKK